MALIAWIGLGRMGVPMAAHLVAAGHRVRGFDVSEPARTAAAEAGIDVGESIADVVVGADAVFTSLPKPEHVRAVYDGPDGVFAHASADAVLMDTSTVDIATSRWCHDEADARGRIFVDAPISGGTAGAAAGTLAFLLGGADDDVARACELVSPMARSIIACGGPTMGIAAKLANNMMLFINVMGMAEGSQLAAQLGLDPTVFWQVATASSGDSWALRTWYPVPGVVESAAATHGFAPTFSVDLARKDCALAVDAGEVTGVHLPAAQLALSQLDELIDEGYADRDCTLVVKFANPVHRPDGFVPASDTRDPQGEA